MSNLDPSAMSLDLGPPPVPPAASAPARHLPGEVGIWVFILGDMLVFGLLFSTFLYYRGEAPEMYAHSQEALNRNYGAFNTILLLTSSWFVAMAVHRAKRGAAHVPALIAAAFACGFGFGVVKFFEYGEKIAAGITLTTNDFYMYYYVLTGLHFMHVLIGMAVLSYLWTRSRRSTSAPGDLVAMESGASFWHLVDLLWIVLFPLLYLVR